MLNRICVIGIGSFGKYLIHSLSHYDFSIIAIDINEMNIEKIKNIVDKAVIMDITNEEAFDEINWIEVEVAIVAIGDPNLEASIISVSLLKQANIPRIIARSSSELHSRILKKVGATEIINPEKELAELLTTKLSMPNVINMRFFDDKNVICEFVPPASFINKNIIDLDIRNKYNISIIAIKRFDDKISTTNYLITNPHPREIILNNDIIIGIGEKAKFDKINKLG